MCVAYVNKRIGEFRKSDDLGYRQRVAKLSYKAQTIVRALESGASSVELIEALAWQYEQNSRWKVGPKAILDAQIEFAQLIEEIREVLDLGADS